MATAPQPVSPMSLAEARRMVTDPAFAAQFCEQTRQNAWKMLHARRRGDLVVMLVVANSAHPTTPGDAA